jgi:hypothetical protein
MARFPGPEIVPPDKSKGMLKLESLPSASEPPLMLMLPMEAETVSLWMAVASLV